MIECRLKVILAQRDVENRPPWNLTDLAKAADLSWSTVSNLANNKTSRYDAHVLDGICRVLNVGVGDLLVYIPDSEKDQDTPPG
jgi:DNA-binding Xre family transcriptional regulator